MGNLFLRQNVKTNIRPFLWFIYGIIMTVLFAYASQLTVTIVAQLLSNLACALFFLLGILQITLISRAIGHNDSITKIYASKWMIHKCRLQLVVETMRISTY